MATKIEIERVERGIKYMRLMMTRRFDLSCRSEFPGFYWVYDQYVDFSLIPDPVVHISRDYLYNPETKESYRFLPGGSGYVDLNSRQLGNQECARVWEFVMSAYSDIYRDAYGTWDDYFRNAIESYFAFRDAKVLESTVHRKSVTVT